VDLAPALAPGPRRRAVELAGQAVEALVPARAVARGLAELIEGVGQGEQGAGAVRPQFDAQPVGAPGELHDLRRIEDQHLAVEAVAGRADEPQRRARPALADDLLRVPGRQVRGLGHGPPDLLAGVRQPAGEGEHPPVSLAGQRAEIRVIHVASFSVFV
jgi:hypothetical protein